MRLNGKQMKSPAPYFALEKSHFSNLTSVSSMVSNSESKVKSFQHEPKHFSLNKRQDKNEFKQKIEKLSTLIFYHSSIPAVLKSGPFLQSLALTLIKHTREC